ncbi:N-acetyltransferase family protein [Endozoicomonadaceae bacterium StTr2]
MTTDCRIRTATLEDSANIAALSIQVWLDTYAFDGIRRNISDYVLTEFTAAKIAEKVADSRFVYLICERDEHMLGYAMLDLQAEAPVTGLAGPELEKLYVQERFTGQGLGALLLQAAMEYCRKLRSEQLWLRVYHLNQRAMAFYRKHQFIEAGETWFEFEDEQHKNYVLSKPAEDIENYLHQQ